MFTSFEHEDEEETALDLSVVEEESKNSANSENNSGNTNQEEVIFPLKRTLLISGKVERNIFPC